MMKSTKRIDKKARSLYSTFSKLGIMYSMDELRAMIKTATNCSYCKRNMRPKDISVDHILPRVRGGLDIEDNLHLVCKQCNLLKGNFTESELFRVRKFLDDNPDIAAELSKRLRASGFLYRK